jgi:hypothetical protein
MDNEIAERIKELRDQSEFRHKELKEQSEVRHKELKEHMEKQYATKVDLLTFREEVAIQFGKVHVEIAQIHVTIAKLEATVIKWFIATAIAIAGASFGIARFIH